MKIVHGVITEPGKHVAQWFRQSPPAISPPNAMYKHRKLNRRSERRIGRSTQFWYTRTWATRHSSQELSTTARKPSPANDVGYASLCAIKNIVNGEDGAITSRNEASTACTTTLARIERNRNHQEAAWDRCMEVFKGTSIGLPAAQRSVLSTHPLFIAMVDKTHCSILHDSVLNAMNVYRIGAGVHYRPVHEHPDHQQCHGFYGEQWPDATRIRWQTCSSPLAPQPIESNATHDVYQTKRLIHSP